ncbi:MAG: ADOP family duplicated permease [Terracidiphilus sp.]
MGILNRFLNLWRRNRLQADIEEEIRSHLEMRSEDNQASGMSPESARRAANMRFGNPQVIEEQTNAADVMLKLDELGRDLRYAFRQMRKSPGPTAIMVITLALGIGVNNAVFSFSDAILLRPMPVAHPSEVMAVSDITPDDSSAGFSYPAYREFRADNRTFSGVLAYRLTTFSVATRVGEQPRVRQAMIVSDNFFRTLGVMPFLGRAFTSDDASTSSRDPIAIIGYDFWASELGADRSVIGQTLRLNGIAFTIVGVAPKSFSGIDRFFPPSVYVPLSMWGRLENQKNMPLEDRARHELSVLGRLLPDISRQSAQMEANTLGLNLERSYPKTDAGRRIMVRTELQTIVAKEPSRLAMVAMLLGVSAIVLVIACVNVANIALTRAMGRTREIAIRLSIGSGTMRLVRQLMTENLALALPGSLAGLAFGYGGVLLLRRIQIPSDPPFVLDLRMDARLLTFNMIVAVLSCLLFGLAPAMQSRRIRLVSALKSGGIDGASRSRGRSVLVVSQIALAMVLLSAATALLGGFRKMLTADPGFRTDHLVAAALDPSVLRYSSDQTGTFYRKLVEELRSSPGIQSFSLMESVPLSLDQSSVTVTPVGVQLPKEHESVKVLGAAVDQDYFSTLKIDVIHGRAFNSDDQATSPRVAIINDEFAKRYWPDQDPIGKRLRLNSPDGPTAEVVGVAKTVRYLLPWEQPQPYVYLPFGQTPSSAMSLVAKSDDSSAVLAARLRQTIQKLDPEMPYSIRTVASFAQSTLSNWLLLIQMITIMGVLGLILALVGLYGLVSHTVSRRTAEIGVRMAMGASRGNILRMVLRRAAVLSVAGVAIGSALTAMAAPALASGFVGIGAMNAASYFVIPALLLLVSLAACYAPARRAANLDPVRALRYE